MLIEDFPGLAKTLIARSFAQVADLGFARIQFTPDLMPSDVTGSSIYNQRTADFEFRPGPIFTNLLLADEINRAPPKTQAALLEAMQERQVTIEGQTRRLDRPFLVLATQNPIEHEGTYPAAGGAARPLPAADRASATRTATTSSAVLERRRERRTDDVELRHGRRRRDAASRCSRRSRTSTSRRASATTSSTSSARRAKAAASRSARARAGTLAILKLARAKAVLDGRDFVIPDDVKAVAVPALAHRLSLKPELWVQRVRAGGRRAGAAGDGADAAGRGRSPAG